MYAVMKKHKENIVKMLSVLSLAMICVFASGINALAVLSAEQQAVADGIDTLIADLSAWAWPALLALTSLFIGMKLFKKVFGAAT